MYYSQGLPVQLASGGSIKSVETLPTLPLWVFWAHVEARIQFDVAGQRCCVLVKEGARSKLIQ